MIYIFKVINFIFVCCEVFIGIGWVVVVLGVIFIYLVVGVVVVVWGNIIDVDVIVLIRVGVVVIVFFV